MSRIRIASIAATAAAAAFFGMDVAGIWDGWYGRVVNVIHDATMLLIVAAAALWLASFLLRHDDRALRHVTAEYRRKESVILKMADRIERPTQPMPRIP